MRLPTALKITEQPSESLYAFATREGINLPEQFVKDGKIHRYRKMGSRHADTMWYSWHAMDGLDVAVFGDWSTGEMWTWKSEGAAASVDFQRYIAEARKAEEENRRKGWADAASKAYARVCAATKADEEHPYLVRKGIKPLGRVYSEGANLLIPMYRDPKDPKSVCSVQTIAPDGSKRFMKGGELGIGIVSDEFGVGDWAYLCEGYATGVSVHEATGEPVFISFSAGRLKAAAEVIRNAYSRRVRVVADNDANGVGEKYAKETGDYVLIPDEGMDANDYAAEYGIERLAELLRHRKNPIVSAAELSKPLPKESYLVKGWMGLGETGCVYGESGSGKSFLTIDLALRVAAGLEWNKCKVKKAQVLYLCGEGYRGLRKRYLGWQQENGGVDVDFWVFPDAFDLDDMNSIVEVNGYIDECGLRPGLIIADTLNRYMKGDENSAQDMRAFLNNIQLLRGDVGCVRLIVHHVGVSPESKGRARGSSAFRGAMDFMFFLSADATGVRTLRQEKMKDAMGDQTYSFSLRRIELQGESDEDGEPITTAIVSAPQRCDVALSDEDKGRLKEYARLWLCGKCQPVSLKDWAEAVSKAEGISKNAAQTALKMRLDGKGNTLTRLLAMGWIEKIADGLAFPAAQLRDVLDGKKETGADEIPDRLRD